MPAFGRVVGRFVTVVADTADPDQEPDIVPLTGTITFKLDQAKVVETDAVPQPMVIVSTPIEAVLDEQGYLCTPDADRNPTYQGMYLLANNDPDIDPAVTTYTVSYMLFLGPTNLPLASHSLSVVGGVTVDLANIISALI